MYTLLCQRGARVPGRRPASAEKSRDGVDEAYFLFAAS